MPRPPPHKHPAFSSSQQGSRGVVPDKSAPEATPVPSPDLA